MLLEASGNDGAEWSMALERGRIVHFRRCPISLPDAADLEFLRERLAPHLRRKNVSYYPEAGRLVGLKADAEVTSRSRRILREYSGRVQEFLRRTMPDFVRGWQIGTCSFRPLEEEGRNLSPHASNELVHVDAGAYGATHGDRILRFFVNVNPTAERVWISKGTFAELFAKHGREAGVLAGDLEPRLPERIVGGVLRAARKIVPMLRVVDSSPYDRRMRRFHNWMKDAPSFRDSADGLERFSFPPYSSWMVLTDGVSHACIRGQHALVDTFLIPLANCRLAEATPYRILAGAR